MDKQCEEDGEAQCRVGVVCSVRDEAFWNLVQGNCRACLQTEREESVRWDVVMMLLRLVVMLVVVVMMMVISV